MELNEVIEKLFEKSEMLKVITEVSPEERMNTMDIFISAQDVLDSLIGKLNELPDTIENGVNIGGVVGEADLGKAQEIIEGISG